MEEGGEHKFSQRDEGEGEQALCELAGMLFPHGREEEKQKAHNNFY